MKSKPKTAGSTATYIRLPNDIRADCLEDGAWNSRDLSSESVHRLRVYSRMKGKKSKARERKKK